MIYLDANFFVFALLDQTKKGEKARDIQKNIVEGKIRAFTSVLALDEVMWVLIKNNKQHLLRKTIEDIYSLPNLAVREVPSLTALRALSFIENSRLKPRDALHVAVMEHLQVTTILSDDSDFDKVKQIKRQKLE
ncbi:type II toxin-antitoxin system VapC family toxin [Candidatus Woesearchaeota archaeon]|nr:type II toxin-antitoxin system VapC family toxin [Candidatus Woesearchaeota archaeon]